MSRAKSEEMITRLFFIVANGSQLQDTKTKQQYSGKFKSLRGKLSLGKKKLNSCLHYLPFNKLYRLILHYRTKTLKKN